MKSLIIFFFLILTHTIANSQEVQIKIVASDTSLLPIENCYVKIYSRSKKALVHFLNMNKNAVTEIEHKIEGIDTLLLTITHINFKPFEYILPIDPSRKQYSINAVLKPATASLDEIVLKSSPMWQKGDTTFYKVDAYKTGAERKLKDIVSNLPNFSFSNEGKLFFKNKPVSKITIENEDLMADKVDLLLNSFPAHVLDKIEAIENQHDNKLLAGIDGGSQTVVNLSIKKNKLRTVFGDAEMGGGNLDKFLLKGTLFGLQNKVKLAAIFNNNNIGNGLSPAGKYELRTEELGEIKNGQMQELALRMINGIDQRFFIENQQFDNRIQLNTPLNKKTTLATEVLYIVDKQEQTVDGLTNFIIDTNTITRNTVGTNIIMPRIFKVGQKTQFKIKDSVGLKLGYAFYNEAHKGLAHERFSIFNVNNFKDLLQCTHSQNFTLSAELTKRVSKRKATLISASFSSTSVKQQFYTTTLDLNDVYKVDNDQYDQSAVTYNQKATVLSLSTKLYRPKNFILFNYEYWQPTHFSNVVLKNSQQNYPDTLLQSLTGKDSLSIHKLTGEYRQSLKLIVPLSASVKLGVANLSQIKQQSWLPLYSFNLRYKSKQDFKRALEISSSFISGIPQISQFRQGVFPQQADGFVTYNNFNRNIQSFQINSFFYSVLPNKKSTLSGNVSFDHSFQSIANSLEVNTISNNNVFTLIGRSTSSAIASLRYAIFFFEISGSITNLTAYSINNGAPIKSIINSKTTGIKYKRNWKKKFYLEASSNVSFNTFAFVGEDKAPIPTSLTWENKLKMNYKIGNLNFESNGNFIHNKINDAKSEAFIAEAGAFYIPKNKKLSGSLFCYNIFNAKNYATQQIYPTLQFISNIPLIKRTIFLSVYYQL